MTHDTLILSILNLYGPLTTSEISSIIGRGHTHIYRIMRSLERYGFIECEAKVKMKNKNGKTIFVNRWWLIQ